LIGGLDVEFDVLVYDWDKDGGHDLIGKKKDTCQ
jgi:hypothetical protein